MGLLGSSKKPIVNNDAIIIFTKNAVLGKVKTRLAATLGDEKAFKIFNLLQNTTFNAVRNSNCKKFVFYSNFIEENLWNNDHFEKKLQNGYDLGERMFSAFEELFNLNFSKVVLIGTDAYDLKQETIEKAFYELEKHDCVFGPANDGGYYLIGLTKPFREVLLNQEWSHSEVLSQALEKCTKHNRSYFLLEQLIDIDTQADLKLAGISF